MYQRDLNRIVFDYLLIAIYSKCTIGRPIQIIPANIIAAGKGKIPIPQFFHFELTDRQKIQIAPIRHLPVHRYYQMKGQADQVENSRFAKRKKRTVASRINCLIYPFIFNDYCISQPVLHFP